MSRKPDYWKSRMPPPPVKPRAKTRTTEIYTQPSIMARIAEFTNDQEADRYSEIPGWEGGMLSATNNAVLLQCKDTTHWFPFSQLRKAEDGLSVYASMWILNEKGF